MTEKGRRFRPFAAMLIEPLRSIQCCRFAEPRTDDDGRSLQYTPLSSRAGDPVLRLSLDGPAFVSEAAPHFLAHGAAYLLRQRCECLASGSPAAFKGP
jgi:hypothetical protein